jgi:hypothetical protein
MRTRRLTGIALSAVALAVVLSGCMGIAINVPTLTDQQVDYSKGRAVSGSACGFQLLLVIPIMTNSMVERAYEEMSQKAGPDSYIADVKVSERWYYAFVGTTYCTDMEAMAYPKKSAPQAQPADGVKM